MKKRTLSLLTVVCGLCFLIFACRRELNDVVKTDLLNTSSDLLQSAKVWNSKIVNDNNAVNSKIPEFITLDPQWNKSWTIKQQNGTTLLAVPTAVGEPSVRSITFARLFIFQATNNNVSHAQIVEFFGFNDYSVTKNLENLVKNSQSTSIDGFNGAIIRYDLNYRWTSGNTYENGQKTADNVLVVRTKASENFSSSVLISLSIPNKDASDKSISKTAFLYTINNNLRVNDGTGSGSGSGTMGGTLSEVTITGSSSGSSSGGGGSGPVFPPGGNPNPPTNPPTNPPGSGGTTTPPDLSIADHKISCGTLPAKSGESSQVGQLCVFQSLEWVTKYFNHTVPSGTSLAAYCNANGSGVLGAISVSQYGVPAGDIDGIINRYCDYTTPSSIQAAINACHPCMAILNGGHEVMITGYNNSGTIQYFDPQLASYQVTSTSSLTNIREITRYNPK